MKEERVSESSEQKMTKKQLLLEILRFLIVGGLATLVDYAVFYLFRKWLLPPALIAESGGWDTASLVIATALGFCAGLTVNWILSVRFVFRNVKDKEKSRSKKYFGRDFSNYFRTASFSKAYRLFSVHFPLAREFPSGTFRPLFD